MGWIRDLVLGPKPAPQLAATMDPETGIEVITILRPGFGPETAIVDRNEVYPVERYASEALALEGHARWVALAQPWARIHVLGDGKHVRDTETVLVPRSRS